MLTLLFYSFSTIALISALLVISARNPVHSVLALIIVFLQGTALLLLLGADFLALLLLIVYIGAIAVLFLFAVMMLNINLSELTEKLTHSIPTALLAGLAFLIHLWSTISTQTSHLYQNTHLEYTLLLNPLSSPQALAQLLYTDYASLLIVASLILLLAIIGGITLTLHHKPFVQRQDLHSQLHASSEISSFTTIR